MAITSQDVREIARSNAQTGIAFLGRAFNCCNNSELPYEWPKQTRDRFERLAAEIVHLVEEGPIQARRGAGAQDDTAFQRFLGKLTSGAGRWPPDQMTVHRRA